MADISSNVFINQDQIHSFLSQYSLNVEEYSTCLQSFENEYKQLKTYSIKDFIRHFSSSKPFRFHMEVFRNDLVLFTIGNEEYNIIKNKSDFFSKEEALVKPKTEPFCKKMRRIIFTNKPSPYHFDYVYISASDTKQYIVGVVKQNYIRSYRASSGSSCQSNRSFSPSDKKTSTFTIPKK